MLRGSSLCAATVGLASLQLAAASEGPLAREHPRVVPIGPALGESVLTPGNHGVLNQPLSGLPIKDILNLAREDKNNAISCLQMIKERLMSDGLEFGSLAFPINTGDWKKDKDLFLEISLYCCDKQAYENVVIDRIINCFTFFSPSSFSVQLLKQLADKGMVSAQEIIATNLAYDVRDRDSYLNIVTKEENRYPGVCPERLTANVLRQGSFSNQKDIEELKMLADSGWGPARKLLSEAYLSGNYGIKPNHALLRELAQRGWLEAKEALEQETPKVEKCKTEALSPGEARYLEILNPDFKKCISTLSLKDLLVLIIDLKIASLKSPEEGSELR